MSAPVGETSLDGCMLGTNILLVGHCLENETWTILNHGVWLQGHRTFLIWAVQNTNQFNVLHLWSLGLTKSFRYPIFQIVTVFPKSSLPAYLRATGEKILGAAAEAKDRQSSWKNSLIFALVNLLIFSTAVKRSPELCGPGWNKHLMLSKQTVSVNDLTAMPPASVFVRWV